MACAYVVAQAVNDAIYPQHGFAHATHVYVNALEEVLDAVRRDYPPSKPPVDIRM